MTYRALTAAVSDEQLTAINALMKRLHGAAQVLTQADLRHILPIGKIWIADDAERRVWVVALTVCINLLTHNTVRIHNLQADPETAPGVRMQLLSTIVNETKVALPHSTIHIDAPESDTELCTALNTVLGFTKPKKIAFKLKGKKR